MSILSKIFGTKNERELKKLRPVVEAVNAQESRFRAMSDDELRGMTAALRQRLAQGETDEDKAEILEEILPEAFAAVREAGRRTLRMRHFDVQIMGGAVLHQGKIAEMRTGEGKTLVATLPVYLNALMGKGVHVVTVNDYLARRDAEWMGRVYQYLGMTVGIIQHDMDDLERQAAYQADITYGTNNEFGFDYLRDNMKFSLKDCVQRGHYFAIVDEVDSILIDEARTPLIISGPSEESTDVYYKVDRIIPRLKRDVDYLVDEKAHTVVLTEVGITHCEKLLNVENLYEPVNVELLHHVNQGLRAHNLFKRDVDYMVKDGQVVIVDEFTGRLMPGRRWSDGLHQAVEAKEGVRIERENQTLATITFQNYFRMYKKLAGMTGTAVTEAEEFYKIYKLEVVEVPTNKPMIRLDNSDLIYRTQPEKFTAIVEEIVELYQKGRPILVGTVSIEKSEHISALLKRKGVPHNVLNAKYHEKEAEFVAQAGRKGAITIATNMAGRGTDILLGGNPEFMARDEFRKKRLDWKEVPKEEYVAEVERMEQLVKAEHEEVVSSGGLHIIGTERHEARRIDNQLRGRSGRQGDPGSSRFYLSLEDDLMRIYGGERLSSIMQSLGMEEGVPIESKLITRQIERAQKYVEAHNFQTRKHLLEYDEVMNKQREAIYGMRNNLLQGQDQREFILDAGRGLVEDFMEMHAPEKANPEEWDIPNLEGNIRRVFGVELKSLGLNYDGLARDEVLEKAWDFVRKHYEEKRAFLGEEDMRRFESFCILHVVDNQWKDHLLALDHLKEGIGLRGYGQKDPLVEYKKESYSLFEELWGRIDEEAVRFIWLAEFQGRHEEAESKKRREAAQKYSYDTENRRDGGASSGGGGKQKPIVKKDKVGRNEPCSCGSGKKYKYCCGA